MLVYLRAKKQTRVKKAPSVEAYCNNPPRYGEQKTVTMVRMILEKEESTGFPGVKVRWEQERGVNGDLKYLA